MNAKFRKSIHITAIKPHLQKNSALKPSKSQSKCAERTLFVLIFFIFAIIYYFLTL